ncbi:MAG: anibiotic ABC transporter [Rhodococcus sp. (in: high G+C Gram-positive bacteria)]|uniref:ABC transporter permease n=1 Tax=Rhodococcus sp. TaxID=1831 RepID=UPI003BB142AF
MSGTAGVLSGTAGALSGTAALTESAVRADRIRIPVWTVAVAGLTVLVSSGYGTLYPTAESRGSRAAIASSAAGTALSGPGYGLGDYTLGAMVANEIAGLTMVGAAIMSVLLVTRHLRAAEEAGRAELIAGVAGRHAGITAGVLPAALANLFVALLLVIGLLAVGLPPVGSLNLSAGVLTVGLVFTALSAFMSQLADRARTANTFGVLAVTAAFLLRAVGDAAQPESGSLLSWASPIGWAQATRAYVDERWWPLMLGVAASAILLACAYTAAGRRDLGAGLLPPRRGRTEATERLTGVTASAAHRQRDRMLGWAAGTVALSLPLGFSGHSVDDFHSSMFLTVAAAMYVLDAVVSIRGEERSGRTDLVLSTPTSRTQWLVAQVGVITVSAIGIMVASAIGMGVAAALTQSDGGVLPRLVGASLNLLPALFCVVGLCTWMYGHAPRALPAIWGYLAYVLATEIFGRVLPDWFGLLSPFHFTPALPADEFEALPIVFLSATALVLTMLGIEGFRRRDLEISKGPPAPAAPAGSA